MSHIVVQRSHRLSHAQARAAAEEMAAHLDEKFNLKYYWEEDSLLFRRTGVSGQLDLEESVVSLEVKLGLFLLPMKQHFENEINRYLDELFEQA